MNIKKQEEPDRELVESVPTRDRLDSAMARIRECSRRAERNLWQMGRELFEIHAFKLWRARLDDSGQFCYRSFEHFTELELDMRRGQALALADVARAFSCAQVQRYGVQKLALALRLQVVGSDAVQVCLARIESGASVREVREIVSTLKHSAGLELQSRETGRKRTFSALPHNPTAVRVESGKRERPVREFGPISRAVQALLVLFGVPTMVASESIRLRPGEVALIGTFAADETGGEIRWQRVEVMEGRTTC